MARAIAPAETQEYLDKYPVRVENVLIDKIGQEIVYQSRDKMSPNKVRDYITAYNNGAAFPPILVGELVNNEGKTRLVLMDGWHRLEALKLGEISKTVLARIVSFPKGVHQAILRYLAGMENIKNGLSLSNKDKRRLFSDYVKAGKHRENGRCKTYREIASDLTLVTHQTLHNWMKTDFPSVYRSMAKPTEDFKESSAEGTGGQVIKLPDLTLRDYLIRSNEVIEHARESPWWERKAIIEVYGAQLERLKAEAPVIIPESDDMF